MQSLPPLAKIFPLGENAIVLIYNGFCENTLIFLLLSQFQIFKYPSILHEANNEAFGEKATQLILSEWPKLDDIFFPAFISHNYMF